MMAEPIRVAVSGAAGQIAYSLLYMVSRGEVFGRDQPIILHLLEIPPAMLVLNGVVMELEDCAMPLLKGIVPTADPMVAFKDVDFAFLLGSMPRKEGMVRKDLLGSNVKIFKAQGEALNDAAKKNVKVLVVGNPANTNALICSRYAPSIPKENFTSMTRLDENRSQYQIALKLGVGCADVKNCILWGNHSPTMFPDVSHAKVNLRGTETSVYDAVKDEAWLRGEYVTIIQKRGEDVIQARKLSSAMSAAKAACDHMKDWYQGTAPGQFTSMGVFSDGSYGVKEGLMYSFPVTVNNGKWEIVQGLKTDDYSRRMMKVTEMELEGERQEALSVCESHL